MKGEKGKGGNKGERETGREKEREIGVTWLATERHNGKDFGKI